MFCPRQERSELFLAAIKWIRKVCRIVITACGIVGRLHTAGEVTEDNENSLSSGPNFLDRFKLQTKT